MGVMTRLLNGHAPSERRELLKGRLERRGGLGRARRPQLEGDEAAAAGAFADRRHAMQASRASTLAT